MTEQVSWTPVDDRDAKRYLACRDIEEVMEIDREMVAKYDGAVLRPNTDADWQDSPLYTEAKAILVVPLGPGLRARQPMDVSLH